MKNTFWNEASRGGAILGAASVAFTCVGLFLPQGAVFVMEVVSFVVTLYLLFYFTKKRADKYPKQGYAYAQCLGFMVAMGVFAGIILGAYQIVASNFLFADIYEQKYQAALAVYAQYGGFDNNMMDMLTSTIHSYIFSPIPALISNVLASIFTYGFYGLFISIGTKREADIFDKTTSDEE